MSWISVALSVTLLYKNQEKCYIVIVHLCYRASTVVFHKIKVNQFSLCIYVRVRFAAQLCFFYCLFVFMHNIIFEENYLFSFSYLFLVLWFSLSY